MYAFSRKDHPSIRCILTLILILMVIERILKKMEDKVRSISSTCVRKLGRVLLCTFNLPNRLEIFPHKSAERCRKV